MSEPAEQMSGDRSGHAPQAPGELRSLRDTLDVLKDVASDREKLSLGEALDAIGQHSFAPLLLLSGLVMVLPGPADIPGVPVVLGALVIIIAVQMVLKRDHLWIPHWLEKREVDGGTVKKMIRWMRRPAGWIDSLTKERFTWLMDHGAYATTAVACIFIASATPVLEFVPFSANLAGGAIAIFGLALMARDGLLAAIAILLSLGVVAMIVQQFL